MWRQTYYFLTRKKVYTNINWFCFLEISFTRENNCKCKKTNVFYNRSWVWNIMLWKHFRSFIDLTGRTKTLLLKGNTDIPHLTDSTFSIREYNSKNRILSVSEVQYIKISMLKCYFTKLCDNAVWYNSSSFIFNVFNFNPERTKFTTKNSTNEASHILKSTFNTSPIMAYSKISIYDNPLKLDL